MADMHHRSLHSPCLSNPMNTSDGLQFLSGVQHWFNKQDMSSFNQVEAICTGVDWQQQNADFTVRLEALQILLHHNQLYQTTT